MLQYIRSLQIPASTCSRSEKAENFNQVCNCVRPALYNQAVLQLLSAIIDITSLTKEFPFLQKGTFCQLIFECFEN